MWLSAIVLDHDENREDDNSKDDHGKKRSIYAAAYPYPDGRVRWLGRGSTPFLLGRRIPTGYCVDHVRRHGLLGH